MQAVDEHFFRIFNKFNSTLFFFVSVHATILPPSAEGSVRNQRYIFHTFGKVLNY